MGEKYWYRTLKKVTNFQRMHIDFIPIFSTFVPCISLLSTYPIYYFCTIV